MNDAACAVLRRAYRENTSSRTGTLSTAKTSLRPQIYRSVQGSTPPSQKRRRISCAPIAGVVDNPAILARARCRTRTGNGTHSAPNIRRTEGVSFYAPSLSRFLRFSSNMGSKQRLSHSSATSRGAACTISQSISASSSCVFPSVWAACCLSYTADALLCACQTWIYSALQTLRHIKTPRCAFHGKRCSNIGEGLFERCRVDAAACDALPCDFVFPYSQGLQRPHRCLYFVF